MTTVLYADEWVTVTVDAARGLVRYERTEKPYATGSGEIERSYANIREMAQRVLPGMKLLIDLRRAPPRNDAAFESLAGGALEVLLKRFTKHATLVRTAVGKLQTVRLASQRGAEAHAFDDEAAALRYLGV